MSHLRIQTHDGHDIVRISLETGATDVLRPAHVGVAAVAFWDAVQTMWLAMVRDGGGPNFKDFICRAGDPGPPGNAGDPGDFQIVAGSAGIGTDPGTGNGQPIRVTCPSPPGTAHRHGRTKP